MYSTEGQSLLRLTLIMLSAAVVSVCAGLAMPSAAPEENPEEIASPCDAPLPDEEARDVVSLSDTPSRGQSLPLTEEELDLLARVISAEARGESYDGQVAVGAVVLNRVESDDFPDSVAEVCSQPGAFCGVADGQVNIEPSPSCRKAAEAAAAGQDPTGGALYFYNPKTAASEWIRSRPVVIMIGNHCFCV